MIWIQLTAGRGPGECQIAVHHLTDILVSDAQKAGLDAVVIATQEGPHGLLSSLVALTGDADALAASWEGTIKWVCPSPIRKGWGRKNWFISVDVIRPPEAAKQLRDADLRFEACRASGPGGQHVNKTNSAIRVIHIPSGITAQAQEERSQHRNKALAVARLAHNLEKQNTAIVEATEREKWSKHDELERGNPVRTYRGIDFK